MIKGTWHHAVDPGPEFAMAGRLVVGADILFRDKWPGLMMAGLMLMILGGCARQAIVLVPDPEGHVGKAEVTTSGGTQVLQKSGDMTRTSGASNPPSAVTRADPAFISATFGEALAVEPSGRTFTLLFRTGTTILQPASMKLIPVIASAVKRRSAVSIRISGHTDTTGPDAVNDPLSRARAKRVKALLVQRGVKPKLISVAFHGKHRLAVPTRDGVPKLQNRRAVVVVR
jgi:outer membrane protein OmpA-like peptidoglycan-associated protein